MGKHRDMLTLPKHLILNSSERAMVESHIAALSRFLVLGEPFTHREKVLTNDQAHGALIAGLLIKGGGIKLDKAAADQLTEDYLDAIEDLPAWTVREALRKWNRAESPVLDRKPHDFKWRPEPPTLRRLAWHELWTIKGRIEVLQKVLAAVPLIEFSDEQCQNGRLAMQGLMKRMNSGEGIGALSFEEAVELGKQSTAPLLDHPAGAYQEAGER